MSFSLFTIHDELSSWCESKQRKKLDLHSRDFPHSSSSWDFIRFEMWSACLYRPETSHSVKTCRRDEMRESKLSLSLFSIFGRFSRVLEFSSCSWLSVGQFHLKTWNEKNYFRRFFFFSVHSFNFDCEFAVQQLRPLKDQKSRKSQSIMLHREGRKMQTKSKKMRN